MIGDCADSWLSWTGPGTRSDVQSEGGDGGERAPWRLGDAIACVAGVAGQVRHADRLAAGYRGGALAIDAQFRGKTAQVLGL